MNDANAPAGIKWIADDVRPGRAVAPPPFDMVMLSYEDRYLRRKILTTVHGAQVLVDLVEAVSLNDHDRLMLRGGGTLEVIAAQEDLAEVRGDGLAALAWHIGNRHTPAQIEQNRLLIRRDHVLEAMLRRLGANLRHVCEPFQPEGGAYGHGRTHGHSHSHDPHADPNSHITHRHG